MKNEKFLDQLINDLQPVKTFAPPIQTALYWFVIAVLIIATLDFFMMPLRADLAQKLSEFSFILQWIFLLLISVLAAMAVSWIGRPGRPGQKLLINASFLLMGVFSSIFAARGLQMGAHLGCEFGGVRCMAAIIMLSILPAAFFFWQSRRAASVYPGLSGSLIGLASGTIGATALALSCDDDKPFHLLEWHLVFPLLLLCVMGFLAGRKVLRW